MPGQSTNKGNPASHRMSNAQLKARRQRSWQTGKVRKQRRIEAQKLREAANRALKAAGAPTAWQIARAKRTAAREAAGLPAIWAKRQAEQGN